MRTEHRVIFATKTCFVITHYAIEEEMFYSIFQKGILRNCLDGESWLKNPVGNSWIYMCVMLIERDGVKPFSSSWLLITYPIDSSTQASPYHLGITSLAFMTKECVAFALYPNLGRHFLDLKVVWTCRRYSCQECIEHHLALHQET